MAVLALAVLSLFATEKTATLIAGKCSICHEEHEKSTVSMNPPGPVITVYCGNGHYDEDGKFIPPPCNRVTYTGQCSRGHHIESDTP